MCSLTYCSHKSKEVIILINFQSQHFLAKISSNDYFIKLSKQRVDVSYIFTLRLPQHYKIFAAADWNNNATSSFPLTKL